MGGREGGALKDQSFKKDEVALLKKKNHTRLVKTGVEDSARLYTWCLPLSHILSLRPSMPIPSDRNITGKN